MVHKLLLMVFMALFHLALYGETEPNNTMLEANNLPYNGTQTGTLSGADSEDWFVINIPQGGIFTLTLHKTGGGNGTLYFYDGEKAGNPEIKNIYLGFSDSPAEGWALTLPALAGKYYARFVKNSDNVNYQVNASLTAPLFAEDTEPNDTVTKSSVMPVNGSVSGNVHYYDAGKGTDLQDWYKIDVLQGGILNLKIYKKGPGNAWLSFRDGQKDGLPEISNYYFQYWESPEEGWTWSYPVLQGTYYFLIGGGENIVDYKIENSLAPAGFIEDTEPNDSIAQALTMPVNGSVSGNIHYYAAGKGFDPQDWYKITIPRGGILSMKIHKKGPGNTWLYFRDSLKVGLAEISNYYFNYWESPEEGWVWSYPVLAGTYYFQIMGGEYVLDYKLDTKFDLPVWGEDIEPNDSLNMAQNFQVNDSIGGLLGYYVSGKGIDNWDWFVINTTEFGYHSFRIDKKGYNNCNVRLRDETSEIASQYLGFGDLSATFGKLVPAGKYYLGFEKNSGDLQYKTRMKFTPVPKAEFAVSRSDNSFAFENRTIEGDTYEWNFDDGLTAVTVNPYHEYLNPGNYDVCLIAKNIVGADTVCYQQIVPGIDRIFPNQGGNTGDVTIQVFGGGLDTFYTGKIMQGTTVIATSDFTGFAGKSSIQVRFDLRTKPVGKYDLLIEKPGGPSYLLLRAFNIVEGDKADPWVNISGRGRILFNTWTTYTVNYGNNGNVDAKLVPVWLSFSRSPGLEIEFVNSSIYDPDSASTDLPEEGLFADLDSLFGQPNPVRVYPLLLPLIPAGSSKSFNIRVKTGGSLNINAWTEKPWFQSPVNEPKLNCVADALAEAPPELQMTDKVECTKMFMTILFYQTMDYYWDNALYFNLKKPEFFVTTIKCMRAAVKMCGVKSKEDREKIGDWVMNTWVNRFLEGIKTAPSASAAKSGLINSDFEQCKAEFEPQNPQSMPLTAVSSLDPNEKSGPSGYGTDNYISLTRNMPYTIYFENKASATAPAHTVTITDQLDTAKFDLTTFSFGDVRIGDSIVQPQTGLKEFVLDKKLDNLNVVARISGKLDTLTGKVEWIMRSLDPVSFAVIEDPDIGLLPPNVTSPEGEGNVSFFVKLKTDPEHKLKVFNQANIVFDANPAIVTNKHLTTFDLAAPQSAVQPLSATTAISQFELNWAGSDDGSGIQKYNIYYRINGGTFTLWKAGTTETSGIFLSNGDNLYQFYSEAIDIVGNRELLPEQPDAETNVITGQEDLLLPGLNLMVYPVPATDKLLVNIDVAGNFTFRIFGIDGRSQLEKTVVGNNLNSIDIDFLQEGLYTWQLVNDGSSKIKAGKFSVHK